MNSNHEKKSGMQVANYAQILVLRGEWRKRALTWPGSRHLLAIHVPITQPDTMAILGTGKYFQLFMVGDQACAECYPKDPELMEKEKDLSSLVEFLRRWGA